MDVLSRMRLSRLWITARVFGECVFWDPSVGGGSVMVKKQEAVVVLSSLSPPWRSIEYIFDPGVRLDRTRDKFRFRYKGHH